MPSEASKLLERMRRSKSGWKRNDIDRLYDGFGFIISKGGAHDKVTHPDFPQLITAVPRHHSVAPYLVGQAIRLIDKLAELRKEKGQADE